MTTTDISTGYSPEQRASGSSGVSGPSEVSAAAQIFPAQVTRLHWALKWVISAGVISFASCFSAFSPAQSLLAEPVVYVLKPGQANLDYITYFSNTEKFDVSAFNIRDFTDLQSQILEGESALQQGSAEDVNATGAIRFTLQNEQGQVTVVIQHSDGALNADHFVYSSPKAFNRVTGSP